MLEPGDDFVRFMTIHKSKGLQFGAVALPDLSRAFRGKDSVGPLLIERAAGRIEVRPSAKITSAGYEQLARTELENLRAERARQLYVACTRAERCLLLPLYWRKNADKTKDCLLAFLEQTGRLAPAADIPYGRAQGSISYVDTTRWQQELSAPGGLSQRPKKGADEACEELLEERQKWQDQRNVLIARATWAPPLVWPSALEGDILPSPLADEGPSVTDGKGLGALFHRVMRSVPLRPEESGEDFGQFVQGLADLEAAAAGMNETAAGEAARLACDAAANPAFLQLLQGAESVRREVPFCTPLRLLPVCEPSTDGYLEGSIDLLAVGKGKATIIDYKTDHIPQEGIEALERRYWPQLGLYALALRACGGYEGETEMVLYFVRARALRSRQLDSALIQTVRESLRKVLPEPPR